MYKNQTRNLQIPQNLKQTRDMVTRVPKPTKNNSNVVVSSRIPLSNSTPSTSTLKPKMDYVSLPHKNVSFPSVPKDPSRTVPHTKQKDSPLRVPKKNNTVLSAGSKSEVPKTVLPARDKSRATSRPAASIHRPIIIQATPHHRMPPPMKPVLDQGIVFYVYSGNHCHSTPKYMMQTLRNSEYIKMMDKTANIALITNCNVPKELEAFIDVIYYIHDSDVFPGSQWYTRVLYNAYPPFKLNFVLDTHIWPCDSLAVKELFDRFNASDVDISFGNRMNHRRSVMGAAALFRSNEATNFYWRNVYKNMRKRRVADDQSGMLDTLKRYQKKRIFKFQWLSFNWVFASHGVTTNGKFRGSGRCYRVSLPVNGPVRFIHGSPMQCELMNGHNRELINRQRCYFSPSKCTTKGKALTVAFSESQLKDLTSPSPAPNLHWKMFAEYSRTDIFWPERTA